jgi:hypothetical protein
MTETDARNLLLAHGIPEAVLDVWRGESSSSPLRTMWAAPDFRMAKEVEDCVPGLAGLVPIFEQNGEAVVGYLPPGKRFVRVYYEDGALGEEAIEVMGIGYPQFAGKVLLEFEEAGLEYYSELVTILQFEHGSELRALLDAEAYDDDAMARFHSGLASGEPD